VNPTINVKTAILQAGHDLLKTQGIAALSQLRVAKAAGIKQSHLTYYFPRRSDLLLAIATHAVDTVSAELSARLEHSPPKAALLDTLSKSVIGGVHPRIMLGLAVAADEEPALRVPLRKLIRTIRSSIQAAFECAGIAGSEGATLLLHAAVVGLSVMHHAQQSAASAREARNGVAALLTLLGGAEHANDRPPATAHRGRS